MSGKGVEPGRDIGLIENSGEASFGADVEDVIDGVAGEDRLLTVAGARWLLHGVSRASSVGDTDTPDVIGCPANGPGQQSQGLRNVVLDKDEVLSSLEFGLDLVGDPVLSKGEGGIFV